MLIDLQDDDLMSFSTWTENLTAFPIVPPFTGEPGIKAALPDQVSALIVFQLFFTHELVQIIKTETNR